MTPWARMPTVLSLISRTRSVERSDSCCVSGTGHVPPTQQHVHSPEHPHNCSRLSNRWEWKLSSMMKRDHVYVGVGNWEESPLACLVPELVSLSPCHLPRIFSSLHTLERQHLQRVCRTHFPSQRHPRSCETFDIENCSLSCSLRSTLPPPALQFSICTEAHVSAPATHCWVESGESQGFSGTSNNSISSHERDALMRRSAWLQGKLMRNKH